MNDSVGEVILKIDAGAGVGEGKLDEMTHELIAELNAQSGAEVAQPLQRPAKTGEMIGVSVAVVGAVTLYVTQKMADALIPKIAESIWDWVRGKKKTPEPLKIEFTKDKQKVVITSTLSKAETIKILKGLFN
jgi:hypothetical protein